VRFHLIRKAVSTLRFDCFLLCKNCPRIADNLQKASWSLGWVSALDVKVIAMESVHCAYRRNPDSISGTGTGDTRVGHEFDLTRKT